jgi:type III pantothenate kinase
MLLAIDVGNTNTVFALFDGDYLRGVWRMATNSQRTADEYAVFLETLIHDKHLPTVIITAAIIGSVVPDANFNLSKLCRDYFKCEPRFVGTPDINPGLKILLDKPDEIGADRIINAVGALAVHKPPLLIIDFGTATTFDVVDADGHYAGGAIAPGIHLSLRALHLAAAKLPRVDIAPTKQAIGKNTHEAIQSGIYWGYVGLISGLIARIASECGQPMTVIATGGLATLFKDAIPAIQHIDQELTLRGLYLLHARNKVG